MARAAIGKRVARAAANANIALVKYWGKRNERLRLPRNGSISLTLDGLTTETTVEVDPDLSADRLVLDGTERVGREVARVSAFLDLVRAAAAAASPGGDASALPRARVVSQSRVPVAAGLASSAARIRSYLGPTCSALKASCFSRRRSVSAIARSIEPVT